MWFPPFLSKYSVLMDRKRYNKCAKRHVDCDDRISELPDEILVGILSLLPVTEAARTSVLSSRWMNLWKHTQCLNLTAPFSIFTLVDRDKQDFVRWVNRVLGSHKALTLKEFVIRFPLDRRNRDAITQWLEFAFSRRVERLELDLEARVNPIHHYCFPENFKRQVSDNFSSLKVLSFKSVEVTDEDIDFFLRNCPLLEQLIVHNSKRISKPQVCGSSSLKLKHLEIVRCSSLRSLKISVPSLTSLSVSILERLSIENAPMLVEIFVDCVGDYTPFTRLSAALSGCVSQLEILRLRLGYLKRTTTTCVFPQLPKLKKFEVEYLAEGGENLIRPTVFIRASPCLEEFVLKFMWYELRRDRQVKDDIVFAAKSAPSFPHHHLKVFKFCGYYGRSTNEDALIRYVLDNCVVLEKLIIDPSRSIGEDKLYVERNARKIANQQLRRRVPRRVKLVIL